MLGHETMGEVVEVGSENKALKVGDRVVVPFTISCGECFFCKRGFFAGCERSNPNAKAAEKLWGHSTPGCSDTRICSAALPAARRVSARPYADVGPIKVPEGLERRSGTVPVGHFPDRLHGCGLLQSQRRRDGRDLGLRTRSDSSPSRARFCSAPSASSRSTRLPRTAGARRSVRRQSPLDFTTGGCLRPDPGIDLGARRRRLHRCRRHRA